MPGFDMKDYVPVNERIDQFYRQFPEGSIQSEIVELSDKRVTVKAYAYRTPADPRPGTGHSSLDIPGATPYTRGSEIENAETSAWGRAIAALGFEVKRGVASAEEVRNKSGQRPAKPEQTGPSDEQIRARYAWAKALRWTDTELDDAMAAATGQTPMDATDAAWKVFARRLRDGEIQHEQSATTTDAQEASSAPTAQSTGRQEGPSGAAPVPPPAEPTLDDVLAVTGGAIEQPDGGAPPAAAPVSGGGAVPRSSTRDAHEAAEKARARAGR